jgi:protein SCO1/2
MLGTRFRQIARKSGGSGNHRFRLLSISFDRTHDGPEALAEYARRFGADAKEWRIARVVDGAQLPRLLKSFGVVVIPDQSGDFQHNVAVSVVSRSGRLTRVLDYDASWPAIGAALAAL